MFSFPDVSALVGLGGSVKKEEEEEGPREYVLETEEFVLSTPGPAPAPHTD